MSESADWEARRKERLRAGAAMDLAGEALLKRADFEVRLQEFRAGLRSETSQIDIDRF